MKIFSKPIQIPFVCPINNRTFNTIKGLSIYVSKTLKLDHKYYYDEIIKGEKIKCHFCNNDGRFISLTKGYSNLCKSDYCISKSRSTYTVEGIMYNKTCEYDEAVEILKQLQINNINKNIDRSITQLKNNPKYLKENSSWCIEFWIRKGYDLDRAKEKVREIQYNNGKALSIKLLSDDIFKNEWLSKQNVSLQYWLNKGYSIKEAKEKLSIRQSTFSLEKCIKKYGDENGLLRWQERQNKWLKTLNDKTDEEKLEINRKKMLNNSGFSNQSQELFWEIQKHFTNNNIVFQEYSGKEVIMYNKNINKMYKIDFVDFTNKKVIEYNGDFWHCNPEIYKEKYFHTIKQKYAYELWNIDKIKIDYIKNKGYDVLVIWEKDFKQDKDKTIQQCIQFMNKN